CWPSAFGMYCRRDGRARYAPRWTRACKSSILRSEGVLVYVKASLTGDEKDYVLDYKRRNPAFPHETTGDQFFSEEQFEAYRALGFHIAYGFWAGDHNFARLDKPWLRSEKPSTPDGTLSAALAPLTAPSDSGSLAA